MAKDRHHSYQTSQKPITTPDDEHARACRINPRAERALELRNRLSVDSIESPVEELQKLVNSFDPKFPLTVTDANDRTWLLADASAEPMECLGQPPDLASSFRGYVLKGSKYSASHEDALKEITEVLDPFDYGVSRARGQTRGVGHSKESAKKKRLPTPIDASPAKRRRPSHAARDDDKNDSTDDGNNEEDDDGADDEEEEEFIGVTFETQGVRVSELESTLVDIIKKLQQKAIKQIIKYWLRKCHPQKQATFPYNGGKVQEQKRINNDPDYNWKNPGEFTAPDYWPFQGDWESRHGHVGSGCRHKEPDHIYKNERITLCLHLLRAADRYTNANFDLAKLEESTMKITKDYPKEFHSDAEILIQSLYQARRKEEEYENGEINADTIVHVLMPPKPPPKPKRTVRARKLTTKIKPQREDTPETGGFFELGTPINPSPSANSSFTSAFNNNNIKIESGRTSPFPSNIPPHMERIASQASSQRSIPSTSASEGLGFQYSNQNTPPASEAGDTDVCPFEEMAEADHNVELAASQSLTPRPGSQHTRDMNSLNAAVTTTGIPMSSSGAQAVSTFPPSLPNHQAQDDLYKHLSAAEQQQSTGPSYINPVNTHYIHSEGKMASHMVMRSHPSNTDSINANFSTITQAPATYTSLQPPHPNQLVHNYLIAPPPDPKTTSMAPSLLTSYPSSTSADFNGAIPLDPDWQTVDLCWDYMRDGAYQQRQQQQLHHSMLTPTTNNNTDSADQQQNRVFWSTESDATARASRTFSVQSMATSAGTSVTMSQEQQNPAFPVLSPGHCHLAQQTLQADTYSYPFLSQPQSERHPRG